MRMKLRKSKKRKWRKRFLKSILKGKALIAKRKNLKFKSRH